MPERCGESIGPIGKGGVLSCRAQAVYWLEPWPEAKAREPWLIARGACVLHYRKLYEEYGAEGLGSRYEVRELR